MSGYTATTFAPVQGFIEKSRKLRDLYGASLILSYLSRQITNLADSSVICPGDPNRTKGLPNRLLIKGRVSEERIRQALLEGWGRVLRECRGWVEEKLPEYDYHWQRQWTLWQNHSWEIFWGWGEIVSLGRCMTWNGGRWDGIGECGELDWGKFEFVGNGCDRLE